MPKLPEFSGEQAVRALVHRARRRKGSSCLPKPSLSRWLGHPSSAKREVAVELIEDRGKDLTVIQKPADTQP